MPAQKTYDVIVTFKIPTILIKARNKAEARRKLRARLTKTPAIRMVDMAGTFIDPA